MSPGIHIDALFYSLNLRATCMQVFPQQVQFGCDINSEFKYLYELKV